jgi:hypothetical protein
MSANKLVKRFRRELTTNPKKAAFLGLLVVVAMYFWSPLVWGWVAKGSAAPEATAASVAAGVPPGPPAESQALAKATPAKTEISTICWQRLVSLMDSDPRTSTATLVMAEGDPFGAAKAAPPPPKPEAETQTVKESVTPQSLGLVLTSTIIGPRRRVARINGKTYEEGQTCELSKDGQPFAFTLAEVHPRRVVLTREGTAYELLIPAPAGSKRIEMLQNAK